MIDTNSISGAGVSGLADSAISKYSFCSSARGRWEDDSPIPCHYRPLTTDAGFRCRHSIAGMGKNKPNIAAARKIAAIEQANHSPYRIKWKFDNGFGHEQAQGWYKPRTPSDGRTTALRRFSFVENQLEYVIPQPLVVIARHQAEAIHAFSVSRAYSISRRLPSISGSGSAANMPKRPG